MAGAAIDQLGPLDGADGLGHRAACAEGAADGRVDPCQRVVDQRLRDRRPRRRWPRDRRLLHRRPRRRRLPGRDSTGPRIHPRGRQQRPRVGVAGRSEELIAAARLHDAPGIHDRDAVADVAHDGQVVGDEEVGDAEVALEVHEQVEDLALHGDVERGDRLVADDERGLQGQGARDADALQLAAGEGGRTAVAQRGVDADAGQQLIRAAAALGGVVEAVDRPRLGDDVAGPEARVHG